MFSISLFQSRSRCTPCFDVFLSSLTVQSELLVGHSSFDAVFNSPFFFFFFFTGGLFNLYDSGRDERDLDLSEL